MSPHSSRRINAIANLAGAERYLEIGVAQGDTFRGVNIRRKVAVDRYFDFDWRPLQDADTTLFEKTSDDYFLNDADGTFDIIFIDGLHTFEQAFRDFTNSLEVAHRRTVWLLDDTVPSDPYSAWPNDGQSIALRRDAGLTDRSWHGDVYRLVFLLADYFPMLDYATILEGGNPQTLVWRKPRRAFKPVLGVEAVSRLQYMDMQLALERMKPCSEDEALRRVSEGLR